MRYKTQIYAIVVLLGLTALLWIVVGPYRASKLAATEPVGSFQHGDITYYAYNPDRSNAASPSTTLVVLAGLGMDAQAYLRSFIPYAKEHRWALLAPAFDYNQATPSGDDAHKLISLHEVVGSTAVPNGKVLIYGFSRGSQMSHRFALFYPDQVLAVVAMSAGTYTLPYKAYEFPFGVGRLEQSSGEPYDERALLKVPFWVGVGEKDNVDQDVIRDWDGFIGKNRLERGRAFAAALTDVGISVEFHVFPGQRHEESGASRESALSFLLKAVQASQPES